MEQQRINPIKRYSPTFCKNCGNDTIVFYDVNGKIINYNSILSDIKEENMVLDKLNYTSLSYMLCFNCKTKYMIDWTGNLPRPLTLYIDHLYK